jgi:hypothetical protein
MAETSGSDVAWRTFRNATVTEFNRPSPLEIRVRDGWVHVTSDNGSWIRVENKDEAFALSTIPALIEDACTDASAGKRFVVKLENAEALLAKLGVLRMAQWFSSRVEHFRTLETLDW